MDNNIFLLFGNKKPNSKFLIQPNARVFSLLPNLVHGLIPMLHST